MLLEGPDFNQVIGFTVEFCKIKGDCYDITKLYYIFLNSIFTWEEKYREI